MIIGIWTLALSLLNPIVSPASASAASNSLQPDTCNPGWEWNEEIGQCVQQGTTPPLIDLDIPPVQATIPPDIDFQATLTPEPTQPPDPDQPPLDGMVTVSPRFGTIPPDLGVIPTVTPTPGEGELPRPGPSLAEIEVTKWECPPGVDPSSGWATLTSTCTSPTSAPFTMTHVWPEGIEPQSTTGFVEWTGLNGSPYFPPHFVGEEVPPGYGQPVAWCGVYVRGGSEAILTPRTLDEYGMVVVEPAGLPSQHFYCDWFNFRLGNELVINKLVCPPGVMPGDAMESWFATCADDAEGGYTFTLTNDEGVFIGTTSAGTGDASTDGNVSWSGLADGPFTVQEEISAGHLDSRVWCGAFPLDVLPHPETIPLDPVAVTNGHWDGTFEDGPERIVCYVFNIEDGGSALLALEGGNIIQFTKHNCPGDVSRDLSTSELERLCPPASGVEFTLMYADLRLSQVTDGSGVVRWDTVPSGAWTVRESIPDGYEWTRAGCFYLEGPDEALVGGRFPPPSFTVDRTSGPEGTIDFLGTFDLLGYTLHCQVFNAPERVHTLTFFKFDCPEGTSRDLGMTELGAVCTRAEGVEFTASYGIGGGSTQTTDSDGRVRWDDVPTGWWYAREAIPEGYGDPRVFCFDPAGSEFPLFDPPVEVPAPGGEATGLFTGDSLATNCTWFNFQDGDRTVTVRKRLCPEEVDPAAERLEVLSATCTTPMGGVTFTLADGSGSHTQATVDGDATWFGVERGEVTLDEDIPPGFREPRVFCIVRSAEDDTGALYAEPYRDIPATDGTVGRTLDFPVFDWECTYYNAIQGDSELTINKRTCPPGYDIHAVGADPAVDCTDGMVGVEFRLAPPSGPEIVSTTGDRLLSAVHFGGLDPGTYVITETIPAGTGSAFVWDCVGTDIDAVHPTPLSVGNVLTIDVAAGDSITCDWYNVPEPEGGSLTVVKYACWTETFVDAIDCQIYEHGATFELYPAFDDAALGTGVTGAGGAFTWNGLAEGSYDLVEVGQEPCGIASEHTDADGNFLVAAGEETIVRVYNCASGSGTPPAEPGKPPAQYPNTGVVDHALPPAAQETAGRAATPITSAGDAPIFPIRCIDAEAATPAVTGTPVSVEECRRGDVPAHLTIDAASVDAEIEVVEIVDGVMQAPSGPYVVSWYKETARLGEPGNMIIAGHLNWWNVPEGVFFHLASLEEGDHVEITGEGGLTYVYEVQWVRQESNLEPPALDVVGPTGEPSLTLITCGGEWDSTIAEYDARTVVRAVQIDVIPSQQAPEGLVMPLAA